MKNILTLALLLICFLSFGQDVPPYSNDTTSHPLQSPQFRYKSSDTTIWMYKGPKYLWSNVATQRHLKLKIDSLAFKSKMKTDTIGNKGWFSNWKALQYRMLNNHDSLFKLDERKYQSLTDTVTWGLGLSQTGHVTKVDTSSASILSRQRAVNTYEPKITAGTTAQFWRGDKTWQSVSSMIYPTTPGIAVSTGTPPSAWGTSITDLSSHWNDAYDDRLKWNGGSTGLTASTGRSSLELGQFVTLNSDVQTLTVSAGAATWNTNSGVNAKVTLTGNVTITLSNITINGASGVLYVINDATARTITFSGYTNQINPIVRTAANQVTTSGGNKFDSFAWFNVNGTVLIWNGCLNMN